LPWRLLSSPARLLPGVLWSSLAGIPPGVVILYSVNLILNVFTKICMPPRGCLPNPCPMGAVDSRVIRSVGVGRAAMERALPGSLKLAGGVRFVPFALCGLGLGVVLLFPSVGLTLAYLPCLAWRGGVRGSNCPCTVIGVRKVYPSFCTPTRASISLEVCNTSVFRGFHILCSFRGCMTPFIYPCVCFRVPFIAIGLLVSLANL